MAGPVPNSLLFPQSNRRAGAIVTAANSTYNGVPTATKLIAGGTNGSILRRVTAIPLATIANPTQLQLFAYDGTTGGTATYYLVSTALMAIYTMSQTTQDPLTDFGYSDSSNLYLPAGWTLYVGIGNQVGGGIAFSAEVGDF